jgi:hypothetical protein
MLGKPARKTHQIVGRNGTGYRDRHKISVLRP